MAESKRIALVTGASRGIGLEVARQLKEAGLEVIGTSRSEAEGKSAAGDAGFEWRPLDLERDGAVAALARELPAALDVIVCNAGASFQGFDAEVARRTLRVNFFGAVEVADELVSRLRAGGRVVMVSSGMGELSGVGPALRARLTRGDLGRGELFGMLREFPELVRAGRHEAAGWPSNAYRVSKVGLNAFTRVLARELASDSRGLAVNAVCPGWVRTKMGGPSAPRSPADGARGITWAALLPAGGPSGGFFRDRRSIAW